MKSKFYVTTPIYYVNAEPHIGHVYTTVAADVLARYYREKFGNDNVFFMTGTDEHGAKIQEIAKANNKTPKQFTDEVANKFKATWESLNISYDNFIRTTDKDHEESVKWVTQKLFDQGDIYKGKYEALYCVGCEQYKTISELTDGKICPDHNRECEVHEEEAYLFALSKYQNQLKKLIESDEIKIRPLARKNEVMSFINSGLTDIAISRKKEKVSWGIDLPFDENQTTYVWIDAFLNYLTGLGWPKDTVKSDKFWPADVQLMAKDILRVHATIWQAMLIALGLPTSKEIFVHGYFTVDGKKMSKSLGNVLKPNELVEKFGPDVVRYAVLREFPFGSDGDISETKIAARYNSDLANELGNLLNRVIVMINKYEIRLGEFNFQRIDLDEELGNLRFDLALERIWQVVKLSNSLIDSEKPWELAKNDRKKLELVIFDLYQNVSIIAAALAPFMPETSEKMIAQIKSLKPEPLFPRLDN
jgi:methionyl-tRNA synthetase